MFLSDFRFLISEPLGVLVCLDWFVLGLCWRGSKDLDMFPLKVYFLKDYCSPFPRARVFWLKYSSKLSFGGKEGEGVLIFFLVSNAFKLDPYFII